MTPPIKVALIQFQPKPLSPEQNFQYASSQIQKASLQGAHIAVLPEYHLTSWLPSHPDFIPSCTASTAYLAKYQALARSLNIHIAPGTIITPVSVPRTPSNTTTNIQTSTTTTTELHNIAHFIEATTGSLLASYQKRNLWYVERGVLTAGKADVSPHKAFPVPIHFPDNHPPITLRIGLLICWDLAFPEASRELVVDGAELVIIPAFWHITQVESDAVQRINSMSEAVFLDSVVVARAFENTCAVALCNAWGRSQVAMPILGALEGSEVGVDEIGMGVGEVDSGVLRVAEEHYKLRGDLQRGRGGGGGYGGV